jgi:hypothetical protein
VEHRVREVRRQVGHEPHGQTREHILVNMRKALPAIQTCAESDAVQTAFEKLEAKTKG